MRNEYRIRNRYFCAVLYEDDENFNTYMDNIRKKYYEVTWIRHDKDIKENEDGEEEYKKPHYHILFKVGENARSINAIANEITIPVNYLQGCNKKPMLEYLIHLNNPEKTQYDINEVQGELKAELAGILAKREPEENKMAIILNNILKGYINTLTELIVYAVETGQMDIIRKYQYILTKTIEERNRNVSKKRTENDRIRESNQRV